MVWEYDTAIALPDCHRPAVAEQEPGWGIESGFVHSYKR